MIFSGECRSPSIMPDIRCPQGNLFAEWGNPSDFPQLTDGEIQVWRTSIDLSFAHIQNLASTLSANERNKSKQFRFERQKYGFVVRRGILRTLLGRYLDIPPHDVAIETSAEGKLFLPPQGNERASIEFNLSHSAGVAVFAFVRNHRIGIDIEHILPFPEARDICQRYFAREERGALDHLSGDQYWRAFFSCWTRKEACLKADGHGLLQEINRCIVLTAPDADHEALGPWHHLTVDSKWAFFDFTPAPGYQATLATSSTAQTIHFWRVNPDWYV